MGLCKSDANLQQEKYLDKALSNAYQFRQDELIASLKELSFSQSKGKCSQGYQLKFACINVNCKDSSFHCDNKSCSFCSQKHKHCQMVQMESIISLIERRIDNQKKLLMDIHNEEKKIFDRIEKNRNELVRQFCRTQGNDSASIVLKAMALGQKSTHIEGRQTKEVYDRLKIVDKEMQKNTSDLLKDYKLEIEKLGKYFQDLQASTIAGLANLKLSSYQHPNNPHNDRFSITGESKKVKVALKQEDKHWYNFVKNSSIPFKEVTSFFIKQVKTKEISITTGIVTENIFGKKDAYNHKDVLCYVSGDGYICENGNERKGGRKINDGETINLAVDTINWKVSWSVGIQKLAEAVIPQHMRNNQLFLSIMMYNKNDQVQILLK